MERLETELSDLGFDLEAKRMKNLKAEQQRQLTAKKIHVGRSQTLTALRPPSRDVQGVPDRKVCFCNSFQELNEKIPRKIWVISEDRLACGKAVSFLISFFTIFSALPLDLI